MGRLRSQALPHLFVQAMMMHGDCVVNSDISLSRRVDARSPFPLRPRAASRPCPRRRTPRSSSRSWAPPTTTWSTTVCRSWSAGDRPWRASCATAPSTSPGARTDLACPPCPRIGSSSSGRQVRHGVMRAPPCMRPHGASRIMAPSLHADAWHSCARCLSRTRLFGMNLGPAECTTVATRPLCACWYHLTPHKAEEGAWRDPAPES